MKWFKEFFNRFGLKTPSFFQILQRIGILAAMVPGGIALLHEFQTTFGITLPDWMVLISDRALWISGIIIWVVAKLPVGNSSAAANVSQLPFTQKKLTTTGLP